ncbi:MAG: thioredoxin [Ignavibacteriales bacterium CG_4_9_14_3_um_filter_30_11]|nr:MAG: thioredoxin [Ignavibacteriales bacterium CG_4_9_14_3_um_filter_30_11]
MKSEFVVIFIVLFSVITFSQNKKIKDPKTKAPMLIGEIDRTAFQDSVFSWWFNSEYNMYEVDTSSVQVEKDKINNYDLTLVMGTWCSDTRREVPRLFKILDYLNYPIDKLKIYAVDRSKKGLSGEIDSLKIQRVPTIIFNKNNKETGRIIEGPTETIEKDIVKIITKK